MREPGKRGLEIGEGKDRKKVGEHKCPHCRQRQHPCGATKAEKLFGRLVVRVARLAKHAEGKHQGHQRQARGQEAHRIGLVVKQRHAEIGDQWTKRESRPEGNADEGHAAGPVLRSRAVGDDCGGRADTRPGDPGADARQEHQPQSHAGHLRRKRDRKSIQGIEHHRAEQAQQEHRPPAHAIRPASPHRTEEELHEREDRKQNADDDPSDQPRHPQGREVGLRLPRHHRQNDAEAEEIDEHGEENHQQRAFGRLGGRAGRGSDRRDGERVGHACSARGKGGRAFNRPILGDQICRSC